MAEKGRRGALHVLVLRIAYGVTCSKPLGRFAGESGGKAQSCICKAEYSFVKGVVIVGLPQKGLVRIVLICAVHGR